MQYFNFSRLVNKYKSEFKAIILADGYFDDSGDFVKGEKTEKTIQGAIISYKDSTIFRSDGNITALDKQLFTLEPIDEALKGSKVLYEGKVYTIQDCTENAKFTGVWNYTLKYVSAFKGDNNG